MSRRRAPKFKKELSIIFISRVADYERLGQGRFGLTPNSKKKTKNLNRKNANQNNQIHNGAEISANEVIMELYQIAW